MTRLGDDVAVALLPAAGGLLAAHALAYRLAGSGTDASRTATSPRRRSS